MKKLIFFLFLIFNFFNHSVAENVDRNIELNKLFKELKGAKDLSIAQTIENKIWEIWTKHPNQKVLTDSLTIGTELMNRGEFSLAYNIFSNIVEKEPEWAEGWNKRATVLYLMNNYQSSLEDIEEVLVLEPRHFGALSGQALVYIKLGQYEKAIKSYKAAQKVYPIIAGAKKMIPQLEELIKNQVI